MSHYVRQLDSYNDINSSDARNMLENAIELIPHRSEAYYYLVIWYEATDKQKALNVAEAAIRTCRYNSSDLFSYQRILVYDLPFKVAILSYHLNRKGYGEIHLDKAIEQW